MATKVKTNETTEKIFIPAQPPKNLTRRQLNAYKSLIQDNPLSEQWQDKIKEIKAEYPARLGDVKPLKNLNQTAQ